MTKESEIHDWLLGLIREGKLHVGDKLPSEYELAAQFDVNKSTAAKALKRLAGSVRVERRRGAAGTVLAGMPRPRAIVYRMTVLSGWTFSARLLKGAHTAAAARGYVLQYKENPIPENNCWMELADSGCAGVLFTCSDPPPKEFPLPAVAVGGDNYRNCVVSDDFHGSLQLGRRLIALGHRMAAFVQMGAYPQRRRGLEQAFAEAGCPVGPEYQYEVAEERTFNPGQLIATIRARHPETTVLLCHSDHMAMKLIEYLHGQNIDIPQEFSVTGFGNMREYQDLYPVTSVDQYPEELGFVAANALIDLIEGKRAENFAIAQATAMLPGASIGPARRC